MFSSRDSLTCFLLFSFLFSSSSIVNEYKSSIKWVRKCEYRTHTSRVKWICVCLRTMTLQNHKYKIISTYLHFDSIINIFLLCVSLWKKNYVLIKVFRIEKKKEIDHINKQSRRWNRIKSNGQIKIISVSWWLV